MSGTRYDIFISYARADAERVAPLRDALRRMGYRVFFDAQSIDPGTPWKERLRQSIRRARALVLCWSENTRGSEYVTFEYMQAETLGKRILPWRLDQTPLPPMLELQAIDDADAAQAAARMRPALGWTLGRRRSIAIVGVALTMVAAGVVARMSLRPPPPWDFRGEVTELSAERPALQGVEVDVMKGDEVEARAFTDPQGRYDLRLPSPQPKYVTVRFRKSGYRAEQPLNVPADAPCNMAMVKLR